MRRKGTAIWMSAFLIKSLVLLLGITIILILPLTDAQDTSEETHNIHLYILGEGGSTQTYPNHFAGDLTIEAPTETTDEFQTYYPKYHSSEYYRWFSDTLHLNFSLNGDVKFTIWAICNQSRDIALCFQLMKQTPNGTHGYGPATESKLVHNEPVEFNLAIPEEDLEEFDLKYFNNGERIGIGISVLYLSPQPPAEVNLLYNSTGHPSHMTINTTSVSIDVLNTEVRNGEACVDVNITDAFGVYDIADYDVKIIDPLGRDFVNFEITEIIIQEKGQIILNITWDMAGCEAGDYIINVTVTDNNDNKWMREEVSYFNPIDADNDPDDNKEGGSVQPFFPVIVTVILSIISGIAYSIKKMRGKPQSPK